MEKKRGDKIVEAFTAWRDAWVGLNEAIRENAAIMDEWFGSGARCERTVIAPLRAAGLQRRGRMKWETLALILFIAAAAVIMTVVYAAP